MHLGFKTDILVSVYRSYGLSHFIYGALVLISTAASTEIAMQRFQNRILKIIGISNNIATRKFTSNILSDVQHLHVSASPNHWRSKSSFTINLPRNPRQATRNASTFAFYPSFAHSEQYNNSFVQRILKVLRDESARAPNAIEKPSIVPVNTNHPTKRTKPDIACLWCKRLFTRIDLHIC